MKTITEFHYADYHNWYEIFDEKKDPNSFLGFEMDQNSISRYEPIGITWDDSFCRKIGHWLDSYRKSELSILPEKIRTAQSV